MIVVEISLEGLLEKTVTGKRVCGWYLSGAAISADYPGYLILVGALRGSAWGFRPARAILK
jgi:hypothetical protein